MWAKRNSSAHLNLVFRRHCISISDRNLVVWWSICCYSYKPNLRRPTRCNRSQLNSAVWLRDQLRRVGVERHETGCRVKTTDETWQRRVHDGVIIDWRRLNLLNLYWRPSVKLSWLGRFERGRLPTRTSFYVLLPVKFINGGRLRIVPFKRSATFRWIGSWLTDSVSNIW